MRRFLNRLGILTLGWLLVASSFVSAQTLIRDSELEESMWRISEPLLEVSGLSFGGVEIFIVNDRSMNAFVLGNDIYLHSGLIQRLERVEQLQSVIAHEIGHITGGHGSQRVARIGGVGTLAGLGIALGIAVAAASGEGAAGAGVAAGLNDAAVRNLLAFTRAQEASADQTGALILAAAGINPIAALEVFGYFRGQESLTSIRQDAYIRTHPLTSDRIAYLEEAAERYASLPRDGDPELKYWFERAQAKFDGFTLDPNTVLRRIPTSDTGEIATLRRAIAYFKRGELDRSRRELDRLTEFRPDDPFYYDLRGQIFLESGQTNEAIKAYETALSMRPQDSQVMAGLGRAQLALGTSSGNQDALETLQASYARDARNSRMLRDLSIAYAANGEQGLASLATAERYALRGNIRQAVFHAERALELLPEGSVGALKAQDILTAISNRARASNSR